MKTKFAADTLGVREGAHMWALFQELDWVCTTQEIFGMKALLVGRIFRLTAEEDPIVHPLIRRRIAQVKSGDNQGILADFWT